MSESDYRTEMASRTSLLRIAKAHVSEWARSEPALYGPVARAREREPFIRRLVRRGDDVVIDGFPRSANTFATHAFMIAQHRPIKIGNHTHSAAQFRLAARYGVPALLVLREPHGAITSAMIHANAQDPAPLLIRYITFHRSLLTLRSAFVPAAFTEVTTQFESVVRRLNQHFSTDFLADYGSEQAVFDSISNLEEDIFGETGGDLGRKSTIPQTSREAIKAEVSSRLNHPRNRPLVSKAQHLYEKLSQEL